tara:strand:+ start:831 stop:2105 length:1275 start_codon:yes stop_codon:yes gene_type:complete
MVTRKQIISFSLILNIFFWPVTLSMGPADGIPIYVIILPILYLMIGINIRTLINFAFLLSFLSILAFFQVSLQKIYFSSFYLTSLSIVTLSFLIPVFYEFFNVSKLGRHKILIKYSAFVIYFQLTLMILQIMSNKIFGFPNFRYENLLLNIPRVSGIFSEPSHLAISLSPFYFIITTNFTYFIKTFSKKLFFVLLIIFLLCPSATLFMIIFISLLLKTISMLSMSIKKLSYFFVLSFVSVFSIYFIFLVSTSVSERIIPVFSFFNGLNIQSINNISALAYLKGYQMANHGLSNYPLGVGLNNMKILNEESTISNINELLYTLNSADGSSMLFKAVSELGIFGVLLFIISFLIILKLIRNNTKILEQAFLFNFLISGVRGSTYFDGGLLIGMSILIYSMINKLSINTANESLDHLKSKNSKVLQI